MIEKQKFKEAHKPPKNIDVDVSSQFEVLKDVFEVQIVTEVRSRPVRATESKLRVTFPGAPPGVFGTPYLNLLN
jgi:hypothetical protein